MPCRVRIKPFSIANMDKRLFSILSLAWLCFKPKSYPCWIALLCSLVHYLEYWFSSSVWPTQPSKMNLIVIFSRKPSWRFPYSWSGVPTMSVIALITLKPNFLLNYALSLTFCEYFERRKLAFSVAWWLAHSLSHGKSSINSCWMNE